MAEVQVVVDSALVILSMSFPEAKICFLTAVLREEKQTRSGGVKERAALHEQTEQIAEEDTAGPDEDLCLSSS